MENIGYFGMGFGIALMIMGILAPSDCLKADDSSTNSASGEAYARDGD